MREANERRFAAPSVIKWTYFLERIRENQPAGGPNENIKVGQIKLTKPPAEESRVPSADSARLWGTSGVECRAEHPFRSK
jgi:hypothetical protein